MFRSNWNLGVSVFVEGGKIKKNPWSKARKNNKLNPHQAASTGIDHGSQGRRVCIHRANHTHYLS